MAELYVGMVSGTSLDGLDTALVELDTDSRRIARAQTTPFPESLGEGLAALVADARTDLHDLGWLDITFAEFAADCVLALLVDAGREPAVLGGVYSGETPNP